MSICATALDREIENWRSIIKETDPLKIEIQSDRRALCQLYLAIGDGCCGCPVAAVTWFPECSNTPFEQCKRELKKWKCEYVVTRWKLADLRDRACMLFTRRRFRAQARKMLELLMRIRGHHN